MTEYTAKRARTRGQLLAAGQELLPGAVRRGLEHALGPGPVTQRAEVSRQTWYRYWRADDSGIPRRAAARRARHRRVPARPPPARASRPSPADAPTGAPRPSAASLAPTSRSSRSAGSRSRISSASSSPSRTGYFEAEDGIRPTSAPEIVREYQRRVHEALVDAYGDAPRSLGPRARTHGMDLARIVDLARRARRRLRPAQVAEPEGAIEDDFAAAAVGLLEALTLASDDAAHGPAEAVLPPDPQEPQIRGQTAQNRPRARR